MGKLETGVGSEGEELQLVQKCFKVSTIMQTSIAIITSNNSHFKNIKQNALLYPNFTTLSVTGDLLYGFVPSFQILLH